MLTDMQFIQNQHTRELISAQALWTLFCLRFFPCNWCVFFFLSVQTREHYQSLWRSGWRVYALASTWTHLCLTSTTPCCASSSSGSWNSTRYASQNLVWCVSVTFHCHSEVLGAGTQHGMWVRTSCDVWALPSIAYRDKDNLQLVALKLWGLELNMVWESEPCVMCEHYFPLHMQIKTTCSMLRWSSGGWNSAWCVSQNLLWCVSVTFCCMCK